LHSEFPSLGGGGPPGREDKPETSRVEEGKINGERLKKWGVL